jgi:hypothetical protein
MAVNKYNRKVGERLVNLEWFKNHYMNNDPSTVSEENEPITI